MLTGSSSGRTGVCDAEQAHRPDRAADQAAQHVAGALVAGADPVAHEHERAADVVGDHAQPDVGLVGGGLLRRQVPVASCPSTVPAPYVTPASAAARSRTGRTSSISYRFSTPCSSSATRSRPMPVSMFGRGSGPRTRKSSLLRTWSISYCMKTRFQTSR